MTDRLAELRQGQSIVTSSADIDDIEAGLRQDQDAVLAKFNKEADAIDKVYVWAHEAIHVVQEMLEDPTAVTSAGKKLTLVEKKLDAVRKRLKRIAGENKDLAASGVAVPASLKIRISRYTKLGKDFMAVTTKLEAAREEHKGLTLRVVKRDILQADPTLSEARVEEALESGAPLESIIRVEDSALRHQIDDLRSRNAEIQTLSKSIVDLHQMFTDMSILVEGQQELINDIEYNVKEVKHDTRKAADELVEARRHQKSARKKKMCICILITVIIIGIAAAILVPMAIKNGWFTGGSDNNSSNTPAAVPPSAAPSPTGSSSRSSLANPAPTYFKSRWYD